MEKVRADQQKSLSLVAFSIAELRVEGCWQVCCDCGAVILSLGPVGEREANAEDHLLHCLQALAVWFIDFVSPATSLVLLVAP